MLEIQAQLFDIISKGVDFPFFDGNKEVGYPFARFGYCNTKLNRTKTSSGLSHNIQIDLFSKANGQHEVKQMALNIIKLLVVDDWTFQVLQEQDNTYHGVLEISISNL